MKKIYHVSAPFEVPYTGDVDYGNILVNKLKVEGIKIEYLKLTCLEARGVTIENIRHLNKGVSNLRIEDSNAFISQFEN